MLSPSSIMSQKYFLLICSLFIFSCMSAQPKPASNKQLDKIVEEAYRAGDSGDYVNAIKLCNKGLKKDSTYARLWETKGAYEYDSKDFKASIKSYTKLLELEPENFGAYYFMGLCQKSLLQFDEAKVSFETYLNANIKRSKNYEASARYFLKNIDAIKALYANKIDFKPQNLGPNVNSANGEYWPGLTLDGKTFYFTRMMTARGGRMYEDFYKSDVTDSIFGPSTKLSEPVNTPGDEGTISITADGKGIFFSSNSRLGKNGLPVGLGSFDIYFSGYNNGVWSFPVNLGPVINSSDWESQPSISPDGLTLYFSSARPGGFGGADIYMSTFKDGRFQPPVNLGPTINTAGEEQSPFIHYDNQTLFFSSSGHVGAGGIDIFVARKKEDGKFGEALNVGVPINSEKDELGLVVDRLGKFGYLSSERPGGYGGLDIYKFELPAALRPEPVSFVSGKVFDANTKLPIVAKIELTDLNTSKVIANIESMKDGSFFIVLKSNNNYMLTVDQMNYLFYSANFTLTQTGSLDPYHLDVPLMKPDVNTEVVLNNVFFDVDKFELKPESKLELDKLVHLMKKFPFMKIEIGGHTDNTGDKAKNKTLSLNRAKAVKEYLVNAGIDATRLSAVGYGDSAPIADNNTVEGKAKNRRTVFKVLSVN